MKHVVACVDGAWHVVYRIPNTNVWQSVADCLSHQSALRECQERNKEQLRLARVAAQSATHPADRRIPAGFYIED